MSITPIKFYGSNSMLDFKTKSVKKLLLHFLQLKNVQATQVKLFQRLITETLIVHKD